MIITGVRPVDELLNPVGRYWSIEFYGDPFVLNYLFHRSLAVQSKYNDVYVVVSLEFGGIRTDLVESFCRILGCRLTAIRVSRAFKLGDVIKLLKNLEDVNDSTIILLYPYNYLREDPSTYYEATAISGLINKVSAHNIVLIFNTKTRFGERMPEGGSMHHHVVKTILRLDRLGKNVLAELVKHPAKPSGLKKQFRLELLKWGITPAETISLLNWVRVV
ncbi:hypothetical protein ACSU1N_02790 [Thermogladius sp. 4427co]|uniref:hypothetical protein n=1 Tax=Thermogladius sp. 4427co TaxID=3450718 RepID=UPI003F79C72F